MTKKKSYKECVKVRNQENKIKEQEKTFKNNKNKLDKQEEQLNDTYVLEWQKEVLTDGLRVFSSMLEEKYTKEEWERLDKLFRENWNEDEYNELIRIVEPLAEAKNERENWHVDLDDQWEI